MTLAAATSFGVARLIARPVRRVADAARRLGRTQKAEHLPLEGARELVALAASFNDLSDQLERAREAERSFLLSVSHELKTPLTAIRAWSEALQEQAVSPQEAARTVAAEALRLERLVGDLLDLARMNKSEFSVQRTDVEFDSVLAHVARRYEHHAGAFAVELQVAAEPGARAVGDADRILQIVSNLVENALRLTPPGGAVTVRAEGTAIVVEDSGPGLAPEDIERAFERFYLYSRYGHERRVGTGLGLAIVDELARKLGGSVTVRSVPGEKTAFTLRLPASRTPRDQGSRRLLSR
jgi:signal transduction histidine kinase